MLLDRNSHPYTALDSYSYAKATPTAFAGATTDARGDKDGANASYLIFNVTGEVKVIIYGVCTTTLVGAGTLEVGLTGNTALILPQVADATTIATNDVWVDSSVGEIRGFTNASLPVATYITNDNDIYEKTATADITDGQIYYVCLWRPVAPGSLVTGVTS